MDHEDQLLEELWYIRGRVDGIATGGCALGAAHKDVEERLRKVEDLLSRASGALAAMILLAGAVGAFCGWASSLFRTATSSGVGGQ